MEQPYKSVAVDLPQGILWGVMDWPRDRIIEAQAIEARTRLITERAPEIFESLWAEVKGLVEKAKKESLSILTNGSPEDRVLWLPVSPAQHQSVSHAKELHIRIAKDKRSITASGSGVDIRLEFDICDDGVVCLKSGGDQISVQDAGIKILDWFVFPGLPRKY